MLLLKWRWFWAHPLEVYKVKMAPGCCTVCEYLLCLSFLLAFVVDNALHWHDRKV